MYNAYKQANVPLNKDQIIIFTKNIPQYVDYFMKIKKPDENSNARLKFNKYGDYIGHSTEPKPDIEIIPADLAIEDINFNFINYLNKIINKLKNNNINTYFIHPSYIEVGDLYPKYEQTDLILRNNLNCEFLSTPKDFMYTEEYFFDSSYHLTFDSRAIRTAQIIEKLEFLKNQ